MKTPLVFITLLFSMFLNAQHPGDLYTNFAEGGIFQQNWMDTTTRASDMAVLPDGNLIVSGCYKPNSGDLYQMIAFTLDESGSMVSFGNSPHGFDYDLSFLEYATSVLVLPDHKILIAGLYCITYPDKQPFVIKLDENGNIDEEFGVDGVYANESIQMVINNMEIYLQEDSYSVILCGHNNDTPQVPMLMMISDEGELVTDFGTDGVVYIGSYDGQLCDLTVDNKNNKLYTCGTVVDNGSILAKFNLPDGSPDTDFSEDGILEFLEADDLECTFGSTVLDTNDNTIAVFGNYPYTDFDQDIFAIRLHAEDATLDESFGVHGISTLQSPASDDFITSAILQSGGKYYFGGQTDVLGTDDFMLGRINHDGSGDTTFGTNGFVITEAGEDELISRIALSSEEDILYAAGIRFLPGSQTLIVISAYHTVHPVEPVIGINEKTACTIHFFPNPATDQIRISTGITGLQHLQLFDITGKEVCAATWSEDSIDLNLEKLQPSVYFIKVTLPDKQVITQKLIKK